MASSSERIETIKRLNALKAEQDALTASLDHDRNAYKELVKEVVPVAVMKAVDISRQLQNSKAEIFNMFRDIMQLKESTFGMKSGQQTHTFSSGNYSITIGYRVNDGWDDTVTAGIAGVHDFIASLSTDQKTQKLVNAVFRLLKQDKKGNLSASRVLDLQKMAEEFGDARFTDSVKIIREAYRPMQSSWFIECQQPGPNGAVSVPLSMSSVGLPEGFDFEFVNPNN